MTRQSTPSSTFEARAPSVTASRAKVLPLGLDGEAVVPVGVHEGGELVAAVPGSEQVDATIDTDGHEDERAGLFAMIEEHLAAPFTTTVLGVEVTVGKIELAADSIVAVCARGRHRQRVGLLDLSLPTPMPDGAGWIDAYRHWAGR